MASIGEDLITYTLSNSAITTLVGNRVHQNKIPQTSQYPLVWFIRSGKEKDKDLEQQGGITRHLFDLECVSTGLDEAEQLADLVDDHLAGHRGDFGSRKVLGVFIEDQDDDYVPRGNAGDDGAHVVALQVMIWAH